jgi:hypothetical protein
MLPIGLGVVPALSASIAPQSATAAVAVGIEE